MSESAPRINPEDVFPRRNLPGEAEQWGRTVEDRTVQLEKNAVAVNQSLHGANRGTAAQLAAISEQLRRLVSSQRVLREEFTVGFEFSEVRTTEITAPAWANFARVELSLQSKSDPVDLNLVVRSEVSVRTAYEDESSPSWTILADAEFTSTSTWQPGDPGFNPVVFSLDSLPDKVVRIENFTRQWGGSSGVWDITSFYFITFIAGDSAPPEGLAETETLPETETPSPEEY